MSDKFEDECFEFLIVEDCKSVLLVFCLKDLISNSFGITNIFYLRDYKIIEEIIEFLLV